MGKRRAGMNLIAIPPILPIRHPMHTFIANAFLPRYFWKLESETKKYLNGFFVKGEYFGSCFNVTYSASAGRK